jgi:hypothetical protein
MSPTPDGSWVLVWWTSYAKSTGKPVDLFGVWRPGAPSVPAVGVGGNASWVESTAGKEPAASRAEIRHLPPIPSAQAVSSRSTGTSSLFALARELYAWTTELNPNSLASGRTPFGRRTVGTVTRSNRPASSTLPVMALEYGLTKGSASRNRAESLLTSGAWPVMERSAGDMLG